MIRPPPRSTRTATPFPYTTLFRSSVDSSRTGPLLNFPWSRPVAAAAFQRNGNLWLVFDRPANVDLRPITTRDWGGAINGIEQLPIPGMTVLRLAVPTGTTAKHGRELCRERVCPEV